MKYSNKILSDDNFDDEVEKLAEIIGIPHTNYDCFLEKLDNGFEVQNHDLGFEEWINYQTIPGVGGGCLQAYQTGKLAYEFANGFIVMNFETIL